MQIDYVPFIDRVIHNYEGPYGWNKKDAGGPTKYGITCFDLAEHRGQKMTSMATWAPIVQAMTLSEAEDIYRTKYAVGVKFDGLAAGLDCCTLDYGINSGVSRAEMVLKEYTNLATPADIINAMCDERLRFMHAIRGGQDWIEFGKGWGSRVADVRSYSLHLAAGGAHAAASPAPDLSQIVTPKAVHQGATASGSTTAGAASAGVAAHAAGLPWYGVLAAAASVVVAGITYEAISASTAAAANLKVA